MPQGCSRVDGSCENVALSEDFCSLLVGFAFLAFFGHLHRR